MKAYNELSHLSQFNTNMNIVSWLSCAFSTVHVVRLGSEKKTGIVKDNTEK